MNQNNYLGKISDYLGRVSHQVEARNAISLFDLNITAEDFYQGFLNKVYGLSLVNLNTEEKNTKAIDLEDKSKRQSIQVTSDHSIDKIRETVRKFKEDGLQKNYDCLTVLMLKRKRPIGNYRRPLSTP